MRSPGILMAFSIVLFVIAYAGLVYYAYVAPHPEGMTVAWRNGFDFLNGMVPLAILFGILAVFPRSATR